MSDFSFNCKSLIIGHRGIKSKIMENTLESILHAIEVGVDGVEFDIQRCFTGEIVLFHDETLNRLAFKDKFYFEHSQNKTIDKLQWYHLYNTRLIDTMGKQYKIPKLINVLYDPLVYGSDILINIEIKDKLSHESLCDILNQVIDEELYEPSRFMVSSYNIDSLIYLDEFKKELMKENQKYEKLKIGYIFAQETIPQIGLLKEVKMHSKVLTHVILDKLIINDKIINKIKDMGLCIFVYTINDKSDVPIKNLENIVDGIITDKPEIFVKYL